jgi:hypothetical protein
MSPDPFSNKRRICFNNKFRYGYRRGLYCNWSVHPGFLTIFHVRPPLWNLFMTSAPGFQEIYEKIFLLECLTISL